MNPRPQTETSRRPNIRRSLLAILLACGMLAVASPELQRPAPPFTLDTLDGKKLSLGDLRGKYVLVNFWATWCGPCKEEMPSLETLHKKLKDKPFAVLAISQDMFGEKVVRPFVESHNLTFTILLDQYLEANRNYRVVSLPITFLVGPDGKLLGIHEGAEEWDRPEFIRYFEELFRSKT